jgi:hypothetical protein
MEITDRNDSHQGLPHVYYDLPHPEKRSLNTGAKLIIYKALIRSIFIYACLAWEFTADSYLLKLQRLQNKFSAPLVTFQGTL